MMKKLLALWVCLTVVSLSGCVSLIAPEPSADDVLSAKFVMDGATDIQTENLQKLCKVWGYLKYSHPDFILGRRDWDIELLALIPAVYEAGSPEEVNNLLYGWLFGLDDNWYGENVDKVLWDITDEKDKRYQADIGWLDDPEYLGAGLAARLPEFRRVPARNRAKAPVYFTYGFSDFSNEKGYEDMDYADGRFRLLGLFRFWNAIEYYFPYLDIMDDNWNDVLLGSIPRMLEKTDQRSYDLTMAAVAAKLHDAHVSFNNSRFLLSEFGYYIAPVRLAKADGRLAVKRVLDDYKDSCALEPGDILMALDGVDIENVIEDRKQYLSVPNDDKLALLLSSYLLRSRYDTAKVTVLRDGKEITLVVRMYQYLTGLDENLPSHEILDGNIGLINPAAFKTGELPEIMTNLADTVGLIVDMRQYPGGSLTYELATYLVDRSMESDIGAYPSQVIPGAFMDSKPTRAGGVIGRSAYFYDKPVVVIMDECTVSNAEFTVMALRNGPNVTVIGENSIGADGNVTYLPLPGGNTIRFTGLGVYTPEGGQTQRIGLSPDIYVERTAAGLREGRDEHMEAAIRLITEQLE